ncbi:CRASP family complement regulator-acquiring lipoprotein, partial [Borrelia hermsii]
DNLAIEAFGKLASKMVAAQNVQIKTELENMIDKIREYGKAYHLTAYNTLINKQDKLMELDLSDLQTLKEKFKTINSTRDNIYSKFAYSIYINYHEDTEIGTAKHQLKTTATAEEIQAYLNGKFTSNESEFDKVIKEALDVAGILNKIQ